MKRTYFKAMMITSVFVGAQALGSDLQTMPNDWSSYLGNNYNVAKAKLQAGYVSVVNAATNGYSDAKVYVGDTYDAVSDNVQTGYGLTAQAVTNVYNKANRSYDKLMAGRQPYNPLARIEDVFAEGRKEKARDLACQYPDDYLTASANAAAKTVKAQAQLDEAAQLEKYINESASAYAKAHAQAQLNKAAKGVGFYTAVAAGICGITSKNPAAIRQAVINARNILSGGISTRYPKPMNMERLGLLNK